MLLGKRHKASLCLKVVFTSEKLTMCKRHQSKKRRSIDRRSVLCSRWRLRILACLLRLRMATILHAGSIHGSGHCHWSSRTWLPRAARITTATCHRLATVTSLLAWKSSTHWRWTTMVSIRRLAYLTFKWSSLMQHLRKVKVHTQSWSSSQVSIRMSHGCPCPTRIESWPMLEACTWEERTLLCKHRISRPLQTICKT